MDYAFLYDPETGRIIRRDSCTADERLRYDPASTVFVDGITGLSYDDDSHFVVDGVLVTRPEMPLSVDKTNIAADGIDTVTISGILAGTILRVVSIADQQIDDGVVEFSTQVAGRYELRFIGFPNKTAIVEVYAT